MKTHNKIIFTLILSTTSLLSGCASIVDGTQQKIAIETPPVQGAQCYLSNDKGHWYLCSTPGVVAVHRSFQNLTIIAEKPGYQDSRVCLQSKTKGMAFGNVVFGGCIGAGVDCADGAAYDYPNHVVIPMKPLR